MSSSPPLPSTAHIRPEDAPPSGDAPVVDALALLRSRNRFDETLPSGLNVTLRLPRIRDCILAGGVPLPVLEHLAETIQGNGKPTDVSNEEAAHMARFQDELVRRAVVAIEGEPIEMTAEAVAEFSQEDYDAIVVIAIRQESPKAAAGSQT